MMDAKETIKYLYEHGHIPQHDHYKTIVNEIEQLQAENERLKDALNYAKSFIDRYGKARIKERLGRNGMDAVLEEIEKIVEPTDICPICGDEKSIDDLHRNCGK